MNNSTQAFAATRLPWLALMCVALGLDGFALLAQYVWGLQPCNECVYIRFWVLVLAIVAGLGAMAPKLVGLRTCFIAAVMGALALALTHAYKLVALEQFVASGGAAGCGYFKGFALNLPLLDWLPSVFEPRGMCGAVSGVFLGQSFAVWTLIGLGSLLAAVWLVLVRDLKRA